MRKTLLMYSVSISAQNLSHEAGDAQRAGRLPPAGLGEAESGLGGATAVATPRRHGGRALCEQNLKFCPN